MQFHETIQTFNELFHTAPKRVAERASRYFADGKVRELTLDETGLLKAKVEGTETYEVKVDPVKRVRSCSCPAHKYQRGPCKHVLAALKPFVKN